MAPSARLGSSHAGVVRFFSPGGHHAVGALLKWPMVLLVAASRRVLHSGCPTTGPTSLAEPATVALPVQAPLKTGLTLTSCEEIITAIFLALPHDERDTALFLKLFPHLQPCLQQLQQNGLRHSFQSLPPPHAVLQQEHDDGSPSSPRQIQTSEGVVSSPHQQAGPAPRGVTVGEVDAVVRRVLIMFAKAKFIAEPVVTTTSRFIDVEWSAPDNTRPPPSVNTMNTTTHVAAVRPPLPNLAIYCFAPDDTSLVSQLTFRVRRPAGVRPDSGNKRANDDDLSLACAATVEDITSTLNQLLDPVYKSPPLTKGASDVRELLSEHGGYCDLAHTWTEQYPGTVGDRVDQSDKRSVTLVRGERGSGKTAFAVIRLPGLMFPHGESPTLLYYRLSTAGGAVSDALTVLQKDYETSSIFYDMVLLQMQRKLEEWCQSAAAEVLHLPHVGVDQSMPIIVLNEEVEKAISILRRERQSRSVCRSALARRIVKMIFAEACDMAAGTLADKVAVKSWCANPARTPLPRVYLVIDDIGKCLPLVSEVAECQGYGLYSVDMAAFATRIEFVFVGTGCDVFLPDHYRTLGISTDPAKTRMITIRPVPQNDPRLYCLLESILRWHNRFDNRHPCCFYSELLALIKRASVTTGLLTALLTHPVLTLLFVSELLKVEVMGTSTQRATQDHLLQAAQRAVIAFGTRTIYFDGLAATTGPLFGAAYGKMIAQRSVAVWSSHASQGKSMHLPTTRGGGGSTTTTPELPSEYSQVAAHVPASLDSFTDTLRKICNLSTAAKLSASDRLYRTVWSLWGSNKVATVPAFNDALVVSPHFNLSAIAKKDLEDCVRCGILLRAEKTAIGVYEASPAMQLVAACFTDSWVLFRTDKVSFARIVAAAARRGAEVAGCAVLPITLHLPLPARPEEESHALVHDFELAVPHLQLAGSRAVVMLNTRDAFGADVIVLRKIVPPSEGDHRGDAEASSLEVELIGCETPETDCRSLFDRFWQLGADPSVIPQNVSQLAPHPVVTTQRLTQTAGRPQAVCLALVSLLRAATTFAAAPTVPIVPTAPLDTAASAAEESTSVPVRQVSVRYILYGTGAQSTVMNDLPANPRVLCRDWIEGARLRRNGLDESFWVVSRERMGPFVDLTTEPTLGSKTLSDFERNLSFSL